MDPTSKLMNAGTDFSVKTCAGPYIDKSLANIASNQSSRRSFTNALGKIGDLEVLNDIAGPIADGLRTITHASNAIRSGCGSVPTMIGNVLDGGVNWVLDQVGIAKPMMQVLEQFHPEVANNAYGSAKQIYDQMSNGTFKLSDIPSHLQEFQNLERLIRGIYTPGKTANMLKTRCDASPYAIDMMTRLPKSKFLFLVQFTMAEGYSNLDGVMNDVAFVIKKSSRPKIKFANEDINYYNFRTPVITKTEFEEMTMSFHDDNQDRVNAFYRQCLQAMSPITNTTSWTSPDILEKNGMNFMIDETTSNSNPNYAASLGIQAGGNKQQLFQEIRLYHVYDWGHNANIYHFFNPKITSLTPDDLDMSESSSMCELSITFKYDYVYVETQSVDSLELEDLQRGALYPLRYNGADGSNDGPADVNARPYGSGNFNAPDCNPLNKQGTSSRGTTNSNNANNAYNSGIAGDLF